MNTDSTPELVEFITTEEGDDLIVSFVISGGAPGSVISLTLLRTPKFEFAVPLEERGVSVSHESFPEEEALDLLRHIRLAPPSVTIKTTRRRHELDVSKVDSLELQSALRVLELMNFDNCFVVELA